MSPENKPRRSIDGVRRQPSSEPQPLRRQPDLRPDHELPAPKPEPLLPEHGGKTSLPKLSRSHSWRKRMAMAAAAIAIIFLALMGVAYSWYLQQLSPVSSDTTKYIRVTIASGETPDTIAKDLQAAGVIHSSLAFTIYTKLSHTENNLQAGAYNLQPSLSTQAIVDHLVTGKIDTFDVRFLPGDTLANDRNLLLSLGYSAQEVDAALNKQYTGPLFASKPAGANLEGYLYAETNEFYPSATVESILQKFFDEYEAFIVKNNLAADFKKQGLTLYQGITLASIVQREVASSDSSTPSNDQRQVAGVFLNRLAAGMTLGSDVTYQYAAKKLGVAPSPDLDSPYNTRKYPGLPPGPIATPSDGALLAVAHPASNNYLFFLSGDDGKMYYAKTDTQHQQNITQHCQKKCSIE